ncbi:hypothetical protein ACFOU2_19960 [Bacillus songklensis]|uniref:DeoR C terminal sensor domain-containing protein n=1 Tax=Bacillus songklensis TaxID=1069116 RepID=A0ABV8B8T7_9BACI
MKKTDVMIADHTKFEVTSLHKFASFEELDLLITNKELNETYQREIKKLNVRVEMV